jgi:type VI protein secretion system component VasK
MEVLAQAQSLVVEHAFTIGIGLLVALLLAALVWFWMSRNTSKSSVLENQAHINEASTESQEPQGPTQEQLEEMARYREQMESQQQAQGDNQVSSNE